MIVVITFYAIFGFFGYWRYGQDTASSILGNLPEKELLVFLSYYLTTLKIIFISLPQLVTAMFAVAIFFSYALQGYVTVDIIWRNYLEPELEDGSTSAVEFLVRIALVIASVLVAIQYPDFGLLLSFVGSFCLAQLGLILPGIVDLCIRYDMKLIRLWQRTIDCRKKTSILVWYQTPKLFLFPETWRPS